MAGPSLELLRQLRDLGVTRAEFVKDRVTLVEFSELQMSNLGALQRAQAHLAQVDIREKTVDPKAEAAALADWSSGP